ncbi:glycosyltransferase [Aporhodopirellula aestuarii]|uniref:Glycosyltransferase n=1 Tax=Aporhodopirellula aestuarii TaxID=2950107 RepID=A0ABT0UCP8_9BACT|nr:glycosyltransferase [Aporhodopirellula aestuarii]MCM2374245.1 glycosyltransferase [Aporhodopirellula aestuarii]
MNDWIVIVMLWALPSVALLLALIAGLMFAGNLPRFTRWRGGELSPEEEAPSISVLIPARDEEAGIRETVQAVLDNTGVVLEVVVLDDGSSDSTAEIVRTMSAEDPRVRLLDGIELPAGWNGKQHACFRLAESAQYEMFLFLDADVRLTPTALQQLTRRKSQYAIRGPAEGEPIALLSAFPHQETGTLLEKLLIPMMHYILLCYLPISRMRSSTHPAYAAGCGQLFVTDRESYQRCGTHEAIRSTRHDGLKLPKVYREQSMMTDCVDGTGLATCRMYTGAVAVVRGLLKNASEGIANRRLLLPFTILLGGANILPYFTLVYALTQRGHGTLSISYGFAVLASIGAIILSHLPRWVAARKFRQSVVGAIFHPIAVFIFLLLQWIAFFNHLRGKQIAWRGRST